MIEPNTLALLVITFLIGFLVYFIGFKFLIHIIVSVIGIIIAPIYFSFNPFMISIPEFQFFELVVNGLIYLMASVIVNWTVE